MGKELFVCSHDHLPSVQDIFKKIIAFYNERMLNKYEFQKGGFCPGNSFSIGGPAYQVY